MTIYITQGRYTDQAIKGMIAKPEDRKQAVSALIEAAGGKLLDYYVTFGEFDFLVISEADDDVDMAASSEKPLDARAKPVSPAIQIIVPDEGDRARMPAA